MYCNYKIFLLVLLNKHTQECKKITMKLSIKTNSIILKTSFLNFKIKFKYNLA